MIFDIFSILNGKGGIHFAFYNRNFVERMPGNRWFAYPSKKFLYKNKGADLC